jgi:hypothetical protein
MVFFNPHLNRIVFSGTNPGDGGFGIASPAGHMLQF